MPLHATYKSPKIQNEFIDTISDSLRESIVADMNNGSYLTLMADGTSDRNGNEILSIGFRYIKDGVSFETLLCFEKEWRNLVWILKKNCSDNAIWWCSGKQWPIGWLAGEFLIFFIKKNLAFNFDIWYNRCWSKNILTETLHKRTALAIGYISLLLK